MASTMKRLRSRDLYTVGWIAALSLELTAALSMLDEEHGAPEDFRQGPRDSNVYVWGKIAGHNIVVAFLKAGEYGLVSAATTASTLLSAFPNIKFGLMVGIGAGVPQPQNKPDIRLGDVVIGQPDGQTGGVYQYDLRKAKTQLNDGTTEGVPEPKGFLNSPPGFLLKSLTLLQARHKVRRTDLAQHLSMISDDMAEPEDDEPGFVYQGFENDRLFHPDYLHVSRDTCDQCDAEQEVRRTDRKAPGPRFHYGVIASGNTLVKDAHERNKILQQVPGRCLCLEMEAAGLMNDFPCMVIRGICDYADSHKNDRWQPYAAITAAAYAREFLHSVPKQDVESAEKATDLIRELALDVKEASAIVKDTNQRLQRKEIKDWLDPPDPWVNQRRAISKRQEGTGQWFLDSPQFQSWKTQPRSFHWQHGSLGCGKTVLSSTVIEHLLREESSSSDYAVLFYYFDFNDESKRSLEGLLRSLLFQLSDKNDASRQKLCELYESQDMSSGISLSSDSCITMIGTLSTSFKKVMVILDALDEVHQIEKSTLVQHIKSVFHAPGKNFSIFFTSREEYDIEEALSDLCIETSGFPQHEVNEDIKKYIHARVRDFERYPKLKRWRSRPAIQQEIEGAVSTKANGM
ncbi:hypothetical protein SLS55_004401 [Diplodia seriata]|uniref:Nephrocystin 3-like N-terminal domain-containing protein n=1 Tax=Diplodia seriata TaxID=420778 RepID=A0ABR3CJA1_9PEZI